MTFLTFFHFCSAGCEVASFWHHSGITCTHLGHTFDQNSPPSGCTWPQNDPTWNPAENTSILIILSRFSFFQRPVDIFGHQIDDCLAYRRPLLQRREPKRPPELDRHLPNLHRRTSLWFCLDCFFQFCSSKKIMTFPNQY